MLTSAARGTLQHLGVLSPEWPDWAVDTFVCLSACCAALVAGEWLYDRGQRPRQAGAQAEARAGKNGGGEVVGGSSAASFRR